MLVLEFFALEMSRAYQQMSFGMAYRHLMDFSKTYFLEGVLNCYQHYVMAIGSSSAENQKDSDLILAEIRFVVSKVIFLFSINHSRLECLFGRCWLIGHQYMEYLSIIMSPVLVFNSENIYRTIVAPIKGADAKKSIFEEPFPGFQVKHKSQRGSKGGVH